MTNLEVFQEKLQKAEGRGAAFENLQSVAGSASTMGNDLEKRFELLQFHVAPFHLDRSLKNQMKEVLRTMTENEDDHPLMRAHAADMLSEIAANVEYNMAEAIKHQHRVLRLCEVATKKQRKKYVKKLEDAYDEFLEDRENVVWTRQQAGPVMDKLCKGARENIKCMRDPLTFMGQQAEEAGNTPGWMEANKQMRSYASYYGYDGDLSEIVKQTEVPSLTGPIMKQIKELPEEDITLLLLFDDGAYLGLGPSPPGCNTRFVRAFSVNEAKFATGKREGVFHHQAIALCDPKENPQKLLVGIFIKHCLYEYVMPGIKKLRYGFRPRKVLLPPDLVGDALLRTFFNMMGCFVIEPSVPRMNEMLLSNMVAFLVDSAHLRMDGAPHLDDVMRGIQCENCREVGPSLKICPCQEVYYCSRTCQEACWSSHKQLHTACMKRIKRKPKSLPPTKRNVAVGCAADLK